MSLAKKMLKTCVVAVALGFSAMSAQAGWIFTADSTQDFTNPDQIDNQGTGNPPSDLAVWLKGLYDLSTYPTLTSKSEDFGTITNPITGLAAVVGSILTIHFGNPADGAWNSYNDANNSGNVTNLTFAFVCEAGSSCSSYDITTLPPYSTAGYSNWRLWNGDPGKTPEPATAALIGLGLLGMAALRRRKQV